MNETDIFEHYQVLRRADGSLWELGRGTMGVTYKAFDTDLHCEVALKVILPEILDNEDSRGRFLREARSAARLRHPNIAAIFRLGCTTDDTYFYAMEFCEGETLQQIVDRRGPLDLVAALTVALQISRALVLANELQFVHRDIKPANLILSESRGEGLMVKIIDFGLAKSYGVEGSSWASMGTKGFIGTAHFASPEQLENEPVDGRSDIYSLGATLWFMLTGKPIFAGSLARIVSSHLSAPVPWPQLEGMNMPPAVRTLVGRMLEKKPADRFPNALELKRALEDALAVVAGGVGAGVASSVPVDEPAEARAAGKAGAVLAERWELVEQCGGGKSGPLFRAMDLERAGHPVAVKVLDARVSADAQTCREVDRTLNILRDAPHKNLIQPLDFRQDDAGHHFLVMEWIEGFTLLAVLRARGALTLRESLTLLEPMAAGFDHAKQHGLTRIELSRHQILVHFPGGFETEQQRERVLHEPLAGWPPFRVALGTMPLDGPDIDDDETFAGTQTLVPPPAAGGEPSMWGDSAAPTLEVASLGQLIYELLGGHPPTRPGRPRLDARYVPLTGLSEAGNTVLRRAVMPAPGGPNFPTARAFHEALKGTLDFEEMRPATTRASLPMVAAVETTGGKGERAPSGRRWLWLIVLALGAVAGWAIHSYRGTSSRPVAVRQVTPPRVMSAREATPAPPATPAPAPATTLLPPPDAVVPPAPPDPVETPPAQAVIPAPAPATVTPAPLSPLAGKLERSEHSPRGDIRVEYRKEGADTFLWLIPEADESRRRLLYKFQRQAQVLFSPDEGWLLINDHPASGGGGAQLYRRTRDDDVVYEVPADMECVRVPIDELAWRFYLGIVGLPPATERKNVSIDAVSWQPDSTAFTLRFVSSGGKMGTNPGPWECRYDLAAQRFRAITDAHDPRSALALRAREKLHPAASSPLISPPPAVAPQPADWQKTLGNFVSAFVSNDQTRDVDAALSYYAPTVDYFGEGRVNRAYIRRDIMNYNRRWPVQRDSIVGSPDLQEAVPGQSYLARFHMSFYVESVERKEWVRGEFALEMHVGMMNGTPRIVSIRENVLHREKGTLPER